MPQTVVITTAVKLTDAEVTNLRTILNLRPEDHVSFEVDQTVLGGIKVTVDGKTVDLTLKRQLAAIAKE